MTIGLKTSPVLENDCAAGAGDAELTVDAALNLIGKWTLRQPQIEVASLRSARGRILADDVQARFDLPRYDSSAMDGYAIRFADLPADGDAILRVTGRAAAGHPLNPEGSVDEAIRIFTGAPMPDGFDTVVVQESCMVQQGHVHLPAGIVQGANRRCAGEDIRSGAIVLRRGNVLRPQDIGLAAALGIEQLPVFRRPRVALFSTGDELLDLGTPLAPGCIYDANRYAVAGLLEEAGCEVTDLGILRDNAASLADALERAASDHDLIITSGGMSTGDEDHVKAAVTARGRIHFWRLAVKPGRPLAMGTIGEAIFIGLPGNPVSAIVTFTVLARPLILRMSGVSAFTPSKIRVRSNFRHSKRPGRREYLRVQVATDQSGELVAVKFPNQGSHILSSLVASNGLVEISEGVADVRPGDFLDFLPFTSPIRT